MQSIEPTRESYLENRFALVAIGMVSLLGLAGSASAQVNFQWQGDNNNNWQNSGNWSQDVGSGDIPNATNHHVYFNDTADRFNVDLTNDTRDVGVFSMTTTNVNHDYRFFNGTLRLNGNVSVATLNIPTLFDSDLTVVQALAGQWWVDGGNLVFDGPLSGSAAISLNSGIAEFNVVCPYTGTITANQTGQIMLGVGNAFENATVAINTPNGLDINDTDPTIGALAGTGSLNIASKTLRLGGSNVNRTFGGALSAVSGPGPKIIKDGTGTQTFTGSISNINSLTVNSGTVRVSGGNVTLYEPDFATGAVSLVGGDFEIINGGHVLLVAPVNTGGTLRLNNRTLTIDGGQLTCSRIVSNTGGVIAISDGAEPAVVIGEVAGIGVTQATYGTFVDAAGGPGSIRKVGTGTLFLNGANTNTGGLTVEAGAVGGYGSVVGLTHVTSGAQIRPGQPVGVFTAEDVVFDPGSTLQIELGGTEPGTEHDVLCATGAVALAGTLDLTYVDSFTAATGNGFVVLKADSFSGQFDTVNFPDGQSWNVVYDEARGTVSVNVCTDPQSGICAECTSGVSFVENVTRNTLHTTIQSAIDAAQTGDLLELSACVFRERSLEFGGKTLTLRGQGTAETFIDGNHVVGAIFKITGGASVSIQNLTIRNGQNGANYKAAAINVSQGFSSVALTNVVLEGNTGTLCGGLYVIDGTATLNRCVFRENTCSLPNGAPSFFAAGTADVTVTNCLFTDESGGQRLAYVQGSGPPLTVFVTNCTFDNYDGAHFLQAHNSGATINVANCAFGDISTAGLASNGGLINHSRCLFVGATGDNIDGLPTFVDAANGDYRLVVGSLGVDAADGDAYTAAGGGSKDLGDEPRFVDDFCVVNSGVGDDTYLDIGAYEWQVHESDADGDGMPDSCDNCPDTPNVWNLTRDAYYPTIKAALIAADTGDILELGPCVFHERNIHFGEKVITLRGQGPNETFIDGDNGGGTILKLLGPATVTIENLTIRNGHSSSKSAGILLDDVSASISLTDVALENNNGENCGAIFVETGTATLNRCLFSGNSSSTANGTASFVAREGTEISIVDSAFVGESGGLRLGYAVAADDDTQVELTNCTFANYDGVRFLQAHNPGATISLANCAFGDISAPNLASGGALVTHSRCLYEGATGDNIDGVPTFVDAANGDYRLATSSLGRDAGDYDAYLAAGGGAIDLGGDARLVDDVCLADSGVGVATYLDIGAYELQPDPTDSDSDGMPDACDACPNRKTGDVSGDGLVDAGDVMLFAQLLTNPGTGTADELCAADVNEDTLVDGEDIHVFVQLILGS